jgi:hypothetical protein
MTQRSLTAQESAAMGRTVTLGRDDGMAWLVRARSPDDDAARVVTVNVGVGFDDNDIPPAGAGRTMRLRGLLEWGHGDAHFSADVDLHNGAQLTVAASTVQLHARFEPPETLPDTRYFRATVAACIAWGTAPGGAYPTRTLRRETIAPGSSATWRIPPWAYAAQLLSPDTPFYAPLIASATFHGGPTPADDPSLTVTPEQISAALPHPGVRFPESARFLTVENTGLGAPFGVRPTFALNL